MRPSASSLDLQRRMTVLRAMSRANPADPANPLISGATSGMSERTFARLERFSGLGLQMAARNQPVKAVL